MRSPRSAPFVRSLFDGIASRYDLTNQLITLGQIGRWRRRIAREASRERPGVVIDLGTGTADLAVALLREARVPVRVIGVDLSPEMVRLARKKVKRRGLERQASFVLADACALPFKDGTAGCLVNAFFLRHVPDLWAAFTEFYRVLEDGGRVISLELSQEQAPGFRRLFRFWFRRVVPLIGGWVTGDRRAYEYLPQSLDAFPDSQRLAKALEDAGFRAEYERFALGIVAISRGIK
ncbi:MAG: ubiquinone/menaquinone biosynthesis methyltransferase [Dehalococcoidia bacterium]|nr:ubiquinone/menaquinone biosynthesis methyltransferase [Dehalococcoidia bacterium]